MWRVYGGAVAIIIGIAAFIEAHSHAPAVIYACRHPSEEEGTCGLGAGSRYEVHLGLSHTVYDLLRIGAWALVILGALTVVLGLVGYWQRVVEPAG